MAVKLFELKTAVHGYHYQKKYWVLVKHQELDCLHEVDNPYHYFDIETCECAIGKILGHFPMEISRPTKFLLEREAEITAAFSPTNYRKSHFVQGGLEIPCRVSVSMLATLKNSPIIEKFKEMVDLLYGGPDDCAVLGSFLYHTIEIPKNSRKDSLILPLSLILTVQDIRTYFKPKTKKNSLASELLPKSVTLKF